MSVGKKIVDGARAGLGSLLDKISAGGAPLPGVGPIELERELAARKALAARQGGKPADAGAARDAGGGVEAARRRAQAAVARNKQHGAARAKKRAEESAAAEASRGAAAAEREASFNRFKDDVRSGRAQPGPPPGAGGGGGGGGSARPGGGFAGFGPRNDKVAKAYKALDLPESASFAQVKTQYRKLMRKYHPDMHTANPSKQKAATELSVQVTQAYNLLDDHLNGKKP